MAKYKQNITKCQQLIFRHPNKPINYEIKIKIEGKKLLSSKYVKYGLSRSIGMMLCKIRHFVKLATLFMIYHGIFSSILTYGSQIWGQHDNVKKLQILQHKALEIMNFQLPRSSANLLLTNCKIIKLAGLSTTV